VVFIPLYSIYGHNWYIFSRGYILVAIAFVWYSVLLRFYVDVNKRGFYGKDPTLKYSVIVPVYNEEKKYLFETIKSIVDNEGKKEIIIADDGSNQETKKVIRAISKTFKNIKVATLPENRGKKFAQAYALQHFVTTDYIVTCDSDTVFEKDALLKLITPLKNKKIGVTNVNIDIANANTNLMTRMQQLQNYGAFMVGRKALGGLGIMNCASGIGIGIRTQDWKNIMVEYLGDRPFKFNCKFGEDRFMTNIMLKAGFKVVMVEDSKAITYVPEKVSHFLKQQLRWRISGIIEGVHVISFSWKKPVLFFYSIMNFLLPFFCISIIITFVAVSIIMQDYLRLLSFLAVIILASFVRSAIVIYERKDLMKYIIPFSIFNLFAVLWLWIYACFRINEQSWITR